MSTLLLEDCQVAMHSLSLTCLSGPPVFRATLRSQYRQEAPPPSRCAAAPSPAPRRPSVPPTVGLDRRSRRQPTWGTTGLPGEPEDVRPCGARAASPPGPGPRPRVGGAPTRFTREEGQGFGVPGAGDLGGAGVNQGEHFYRHGTGSGPAILRLAYACRLRFTGCIRS